MFGKALLQAQLYLLGAIPAGSNILIAGGGSGWILEAIAGFHHSGLNITYVDASAKMTALASMRNAGANKVTFVAARIEDAVFSGQFDVIITPFFFDNFKLETAGKIFAVLNRNLVKKGNWLWCDFRKTKALKQRLILRLMYHFFRICCGIEAKMLPDMSGFFMQNGFVQEKSKQFLNGFVESAVYKRPAD